MPVPVLGAALAGGGLLGGLLGGGADRPADRNLGSELQDILGQVPGLARTTYEQAREFFPQYTRLETGRDSVVRGSAVDDMARLSPVLARLRRDNAPQSRGLLDRLVQLARERLGRGGALSAGELRDSQQQVRSGWSARGLGGSAAGVADEILNTDRLRRQRMLEAEQMGLQTTALAAGLEGDPAGSILGIPTQGYGTAAYGAASPLPLLGYGSDVFNTNYNAAASAANAEENNRAALFGSLIGAGGRILGAGMGN